MFVYYYVRIQEIRKKLRNPISIPSNKNNIYNNDNAVYYCPMKYLSYLVNFDDDPWSKIVVTI